MTQATEAISANEDYDEQDIIDFSIEPPDCTEKLRDDLLSALKGANFTEQQKLSFANELARRPYELIIPFNITENQATALHKELREILPNMIKQFDGVAAILTKYKKLPSTLEGCPSHPIIDAISYDRDSIIMGYELLKDLNDLVLEIEPAPKKSGRQSLHKDVATNLYMLYMQHFGLKPTTNFKKTKERTTTGVDPETGSKGEVVYREPSHYDRVCAVIEKYYGITISEAQRRKQNNTGDNCA